MKEDREIVTLRLRGRSIDFIHLWVLAYPAEKEQEIRDKNYIIRILENVYTRQQALELRDKFDAEMAAREREAEDKKLPLSERDLQALSNQLYEQLDKLCADSADGEIYRNFGLKIRACRLIKRVLLSNKNGWAHNSSFLVEEVLDAIDDAIEGKVVDKNQENTPAK